MTTYEVPFDNNDQASHGMDSEIEPCGLDGKRLVLRPFNRFDTAFTEWWFIPSGKWPAYEFGKLVVRRYPRGSEGVMFCGYHVEKGYHPKLSSVEFVASSEIIQPYWNWHQFVQYVLEGEIEFLLRQMVEFNEIGPRLLVEAYPLKPGDTERPLPGSGDAVEFLVGSEDEGFRCLKSSQDVLADINSAQSVNECVEKLQSNADLAFYWIDLTVAFPFSYSGKGPDIFGADRIWHLSMEPWLRWVR